ncbi:hypothetical protein CRE_21452 [Caenorhabditis remanei]|uniref:CCHC-type domain-containing protein n=1 Tax=Caenorhabditis remanei TaxID=31234 RepID=E3N3Q1_CAERE|nr:hypothetical protein CRE_21452 [Caenorhabditis remanei]
MADIEEEEANRLAEEGRIRQEEANRLAEEERIRRENELLAEEPMDEGDEDKRVQEVRLAEIEKVINETCIDIKNQTKFSTKQCRVLLSPLIGKILEVEEQFRGKKKESEFWENTNVKLNKTVLSLQDELERKSPPQSSTPLEEPPTTSVLSGQSIQGNEERWKLVSLLEVNEIHNEEALNELFGKIEQLGNELSTHKELLQKAREQSDRSKEEYFQAKQQIVMLQLKLKAEEEKSEKLKKENDTVAANNQSNSLTRYGEQRQSITEKNNNIVQTTGRHSMFATSTPQHGMHRQGEANGKVGESRENARFYNADTSEIIDTITRQESRDSGGNWNQRIVEQDAQRSMIVHDGHEMPNMNMQWRMTQALPDPPVFSAGKNSVNAETFERAFYMKYRFFDIEAQKSFLETRFLAGSALTVYKGLPESDKYSVSRILDAIKRRLSQSEPEESRRAKSKFQGLKLQKEQSIQSFCLQMDEIVRVGYKGVPEHQISSMKTTKLLDEMKEHSIFDVSLQILGSQLRKCPEMEQYELCREEATRFDEEWRSGKAKLNEKKVNRQQSNQNFSNQQSNYSNQNTSYSRNKQTVGNEETSQNWRERSQGKFVPTNNAGGNNVVNKSVGFSECSECRLTGCHDPKCSRAPGSSTPRKSNPVVCFRCNEQGHIAPNCPQKNAQQLNSQGDMAKVQTLDKKECLERPEAEKSKQNKNSRTPVRIEQGRIGSAEVNFVIDSGACISVISENTWKEVVEKNGGKEWEKEAILKNPEKIDVYAANNTPMNLLYQVKVETSLHSRTRDLKFYVTDIDRDTVILGIDQFELLGIQMSFQKKPRDIRMVRQVKIPPGSEKIVEVSVEGTIRKDKSLCLITPMVSCLAPAIYQIRKSGKARVQMSNLGKKSIFLKKGELVASGEVEGFDVIEENEENLKLLEEFFERSKLLEQDMETINLIETNVNSGERWDILCEQLKKTCAKSEEEEDVWKVIKDYQHIFATDDTELGRTNVVEYFTVKFNLNRTLLNVSDRSKCLKYWEVVERIVKEEKIIWPHLKLETLESVENNQTDEATGASGSGFGPIRAHNSRGSRSGSYGLGSYSKFRQNR